MKKSTKISKQTTYRNTKFQESSKSSTLRGNTAKTKPKNAPNLNGAACILRRSASGRIHRRCSIAGDKKDGGDEEVKGGQKRKTPHEPSKKETAQTEPQDNPRVQMKGPVSETDALNNPEGLKHAYATSGGTVGVNPHNPTEIVGNLDGDKKKSGIDAAQTQGAIEGANVPKLKSDNHGTKADITKPKKISRSSLTLLKPRTKSIMIVLMLERTESWMVNRWPIWNFHPD